MELTSRVRLVAVWLPAAAVLPLSACAHLGRPDDLPVCPANYRVSVNPPATPRSVWKETPTSAVVQAAATVAAAPPPTTSPVAPLPITLSAALALANATPLDVQIADERVRAAAARFDRAKVQWLPNLNVGADYFRHDGRIQDIVGNVFTTSRSSVLVGAGPSATVSTSDAVFAPLAARQLTRAAASDAQAVRNDTALAVAVAYSDVQQARGEIAGAAEALKRADDLVDRTEKLAPELVPLVEVSRAKTEAARRRQAVEAAYERWQVATAEIVRLLRLRAGMTVEPAEVPELAVLLCDLDTPVDDLIATATANRPELAAGQAAVEVAGARVRHEKSRPWLPTVAVRGVGSNTPGIAGGYFGGGVNDDLTNFGPRFSVDVQVVWEFQNLGYGIRAAVREREADGRRAVLELARAQELMAAEVVKAHAQATRAVRRVKAAEEE